ncbi:helix-turn-helix domain-containing protein [Rhodobacter lacus]|uniref:Helix-turn-helix domain-containing protein n=1 Tax=Rhodobacter lacus TaxID=1641972 RepID=A0ABW5AC75_9RHOB
MTSAMKKLRNDRALTLEQLADITGLSKGFLSQIETGKRQASQATLQLIADALGCSMSALIAEELSAQALRVFEALSQDGRRDALRYLHFLADQEASAASAPSSPGQAPRTHS